MRLHFTRLAVIVAALTSVLALSAGIATATTALSSLVEIDSANDDMGSTAIEWSGATYNASSNVLLTVDDETNAYEFQLTATGEIDSSVTPRVLDLNLGESDYEGVAWIAGEQYAFLSENAGDVIIATVPSGTSINTSDIDSTFSVAPGGGNLGPEGIDTDGAAFYIATELPASLTKFDLTGGFIASVDLFELADASGVVALDDGTYLVVSHESRAVAHYDIDWDAETATQLDSIDVGAFSQLEGIARAGSTEIYLFGEDNTRKGTPGQTFSHLRGQFAAPEYAAGDIDCSGTVNIVDAMLIARVDAGLIINTFDCGNGDQNGDGVVNLIDAMFIAQCDGGLTNSSCPAAA